MSQFNILGLTLSTPGLVKFTFVNLSLVCIPWWIEHKKLLMLSDHRLAQWSAASESRALQCTELAWKNWYLGSDLKSSLPIYSRQQHRQTPRIQRRQWGQGPLFCLFIFAIMFSFPVQIYISNLSPPIPRVIVPHLNSWEFWSTLSRPRRGCWGDMGGVWR